MANLFSCIFLSPFLLFDNLNLLDPTTVHPVICSVSTTLIVIVASSSMMSQLLIGLDQYLAVTEPLHYHRRINKTRCRVLCAISWIVACVFGALSLISHSEEGGELSYGDTNLPSPVKTCANRDVNHVDAAAALVFFSVVFALPFLVMLFVYSSIFSAAHQNSVKTRRNSVCSSSFDCVSLQQQQQQNNNLAPYYGYHSNRLGVTRLPPTPEEAAPRRKESGGTGITVNQIRMSVRHKLSNASGLLAYREEGRAAKVTVLVIVMILFCWGPYSATLLAKTSDSDALPRWIGSATMLLLSTSPVLSPILYAYRSRRVQRDIRRVLGIRQKGRAAVGSWERAEPQLKKKKVRIQRMKSFSCPQLVISSTENSSSASTSTASSPSTATQTTITNDFLSAAALAAMPPVSRSIALPRKLFTAGYISSNSPAISAKRKFGLMQVKPLEIPMPAEICPMLSADWTEEAGNGGGGGLSTDIQL
jgi:hypothetical protein